MARAIDDDLAAALDGDAVRAELARRRLDGAYVEQLRRCGLPIARGLAVRIGAGEVPVLGINGSQGSGKTTLAAFLALLLAEARGVRAAVMSIDDFYLTRADRLRLAEDVHPLLATRGVPGTHDVGLALGVLDAVAGGQAGIAIPRFDKARDDRAPRSAWTVLDAPPELVILEGWCVGCRPQAPAALTRPVNALEAEEDQDGRWRRHVNERLATDYRVLFDRLDALVMLRVPSFERVFEWRQQQESELIASLAAAGRGAERAMTPAAVRRFIAHYERLTRHMLDDLPDCSDAVIRVDDAHRMVAVEGSLLERGAS